jgi:hypothetical protein
LRIADCGLGGAEPAALLNPKSAIRDPQSIRQSIQFTCHRSFAIHSRMTFSAGLFSGV